MKEVEKIREAVANYLHSEGCGCCQGNNHDEHRWELGKLLNVPKYDDDSGYDFGKFKTIK